MKLQSIALVMLMLAGCGGRQYSQPEELLSCTYDGRTVFAQNVTRMVSDERVVKYRNDNSEPFADDSLYTMRPGEFCHVTVLEKHK